MRRSASSLLARRQVVAVAHAEGDVLGHREPGKGRIGLEHHAPPAVRRADRLRRRGGFAPEVGVSSPPTMRIKRGLAAARRAEKDDELIARDGEVEGRRDNVEHRPKRLVTPSNLR